MCTPWSVDEYIIGAEQIAETLVRIIKDVGKECLCLRGHGIAYLIGAIKVISRHQCRPFSMPQCSLTDLATVGAWFSRLERHVSYQNYMRLPWDDWQGNRIWKNHERSLAWYQTQGNRIYRWRVACFTGRRHVRT